MTRAQLQSIADRETTVSDKIRALDRAGLPRAEIARFLGRRYQHVRNVLEGDRHRAAAMTDVTPDATYRTPAPAPIKAARIGAVRLLAAADGSVTIPPDMAERLGIVPGAIVSGTVTMGELSLLSAEVAMARAQERAMAFLGQAPSLSAALSEDRRREGSQQRSDG